MKINARYELQDDKARTIWVFTKSFETDFAPTSQIPFFDGDFVFTASRIPSYDINAREWSLRVIEVIRDTAEAYHEWSTVFEKLGWKEERN